MRKKKKPFCGSRDFTKTGKTKIVNGHSGINFIPTTFNMWETSCDKCGHKSWTDQLRRFCTQR